MTLDASSRTAYGHTIGVSASISGRQFFCSWSGGKDSCLSLYRAVKEGGRPSVLLTMMIESGERSRSHGLRQEVIRAQADALSIPLVVRSASWSTYEDAFRLAAGEFAAKGIAAAVFGDIDLHEHRDWCVRVCREAGVEAYHPLWGMDRLDVVREFLDLGFEAYIVAMKDGLGGDSRALDLLGRPFDKASVELLTELGVDACGETGEFHTVVTGGPMFKRPIGLRFGRPLLRDGYWFVDAGVG